MNEESARPIETEGSIRMLRKLLWRRHGCPVSALYGDDGEMTCSSCGIDFKRMEAREINGIFTASWNDAVAQEHNRLSVLELPKE